MLYTPSPMGIVGTVRRGAGVVSGDPSNADRLGWPVDALGTPDLDWADGDDTAPEEGPTLTKTGTPISPVETPYTQYNGNTVTCTSFADGEHYYSATKMDPTATHDMVILLLAYISYNGAAFTLLSTSNGTQGLNTGWEVRIRLSGGTDILFGTSDGVAAVTSVGDDITEGRCLIGVTFDASGNQVLYCGGYAEDTDAASGLGALGVADGVGINARPGGTSDEESKIARAMAWYGAGIAGTADAAWHAALAKSVLGE